MSHFTKARGAVAPLALGVAALTAVASTAVSYAQTTTSQPRAARIRTMTASRPGTVEARIAALHRALRITQAQEQDWQAVAEVMKSNAQDMRSLMEETRTQSPRDQRNALEDLQIYQKFAQAHADGLTKLSAAFATLYNGMTPEQKANADRVFRTFGRRRPNGAPGGRT